MSALEVMRVALARWDPAAIARVSALAEGKRGALEQRLGALWIRWLEQALAPGAESEAAAIEAEAGHLRAPDVRVDAATTRALILHEEERLEEALAIARRAARMAATEGLRTPRILASLVLARIRAALGQAVHATRITESLAGWASPEWSGWIACERLFVSGLGVAEHALAPVVDTSTPSEAARALVAMMNAARQSQRSELSRQAAFLATVPVLVRRVHAALGLLDPAIDPDRLEPAVAEFVRGEGGILPLGLSGLGAPDEGDDSTAWILRRAHAPGRRLARLGLSLAGTPPLAASQRRTGREDVALAVLALAGDEGVSYATLVRRVYRAAYAPELHDAKLRVLGHRVGARLGASGQVGASHGQLALHVESPILVPDPRCALGPEDRVLHALARRGRASARELAEELAIPLRTVQGAVRELLEDGACREEPHGRSVQYVVEDTTYAEPTEA